MTNMNMNIGDKLAARTNGVLIGILIVDTLSEKSCIAHFENTPHIKFIVDLEDMTAENGVFGELEVTKFFTKTEVEKKNVLGTISLMKIDADELNNILENSIDAIEKGRIDPNDGVVREAIKIRIDLLNSLLNQL